MWEMTDYQASSGQPSGTLVRPSRRRSASKSKLSNKSNLSHVKNPTQALVKDMRVPTKKDPSAQTISKRVRWKDQATSNKVVRDSRENKKRWRRLVQLVDSGKRFVLAKDTGTLLVEIFEAFKAEGLDCSFHSLIARDICKTSGVCTHTLAEIFQYMGDPLDDSFYSESGQSQSGTVAPKVLREPRFSKQRRSKRRGKARTRAN